MTDIKSDELFRDDGVNSRSVRLSIEQDGAIRFDAQDMGPLVEEHWGDDDYEFWVTVPGGAIEKLASALLCEKNPGRRSATARLAFAHARARCFGQRNAVAKLAFTLLREKYKGRSGAVDEFRLFCERERIEHRFGSWV